MATYQDELSSVIVLMVPLPAQSHLNQFLQLSHVVSSSYDIPVHYVSSALHNSQVKSRAPNPLHHLARIHFHDFPTPHFDSPQPTKTANNFPIHFMPSLEASVHLRQPFSDLLARLSTTAKRVVIIHDLLMSYIVQDSDSLAPNSETYVFNCVSAIYRVAFFRDATGGGLEIDHEQQNQLKIPSWKDSLEPRFEAFVNTLILFMFGNKSGHFYNTCMLIESEFLNFISEKELDKDHNMRLWAIGPLETVTISKENPLNSSNGNSEKAFYLEWLDRQKPNSVLYISFGTCNV